MRRLSSTAPLAGGREVALSAVLEELLVKVVTDGFTLYRCGPKDAPRALVACYQWTYHVDLLTVGDFARVVTARVPTQGRRVDIFAPEVVVWAYEGPPQHAVEALLELVHPEHPDAPTTSYPAPAGLWVPRAQQRPMSIQPPMPGRAGVRAQRLTTAMTPVDTAVSTALPTGRHDPRLAADDTRADSPRPAPGGQPVTHQQMR